MGRYNITPSVYAQAEWRVTDSGSIGVTSAPDSLNGRIYLVAPF
ncbi:MAG: hypothetical protein SGJ26_11630 [Nitrospirota bacterium]|nr:hypothetical protein [Nitrospirota bacterium]